jgi:CheY-like chemotaxis protein
MKTDNDDRLRQELRLAQLEIKVLREQLLRSIQETQLMREKLDELPQQTEPSRAETPAPLENVIPLTSANSASGELSGSGAPCVLCVEDSEANYRLIESVLQDRPGTKVVWAETGQSALALALEKRPHLVLLDLDLPDMHGSKVLENLQAQAATAKTPVIVISADATPSQIERMLSAGARNYLTKPFEIRRFLCMFDEVCGPCVASGC